MHARGDEMSIIENDMLVDEYCMLIDEFFIFLGEDEEWMEILFIGS